jgi:hypothetical protein
MFKTLLVAAFVFCVGFTVNVNAQDVGQRTLSLVAYLDKTKHKKKEKKDISIEIYIDIKNEAAVKQDPRQYSGVYAAGGYRLDLRVAQDGSAAGTGSDNLQDRGNQTAYSLRDARVQGALLTATKVYDNGETQNFEAVFVNRTTSSGTNPQNITGRESSFGLGFIQNSGTWTNRVFLEKN